MLKLYQTWGFVLSTMLQRAKVILCSKKAQFVIKKKIINLAQALV